MKHRIKIKDAGLLNWSFFLQPEKLGKLGKKPPCQVYVVENTKEKNCARIGLDLSFCAVFKCLKLLNKKLDKKFPLKGMKTFARFFCPLG